jgi:GNAT superfamily N-acetyltransferase
MLRIRKAKASELAWINKCYDEVGFKHSSFDTEIIAIATIDELPAGLGRLVLIDNKNLELGGMYVFVSFRGQGIAKKIIEFLLQQPLCVQKTIYCIPFEDLIEFYKKFGFMPCINMQQTPKELVEKLLWCKEEYEKPTSLLILERLKSN